MVLWQGLTASGTAVPVQITEDGKVVAQGEPGPPGPEGPPGPPGDYGPGDDVEFGSGTFASSLISKSGDAYVELAPGAITSYRQFDEDGNVNITMGWDGSSKFDTSVTVGTNSGKTSGTSFAAGFGLINYGDYDNDPDNFRSIYFNYSDGGIAIGRSNITSAQNTYLYSDGTASFSGYVELNGISSTNTIQVDRTSATQTAFQANLNGVKKADIQAGGSAIFSGGKCGFTAEGELFFTSRGTRFKLFVQNGTCFAEEYTREAELRDRLENRKPPDPRGSVDED